MRHRFLLVYDRSLKILKKLLTPQKKNCHLCGMCRGLCAWMKDRKPLDTREE